MIDFLIGAFIGAIFINIMNNPNEYEMEQLEYDNNLQQEALDLFNQRRIELISSFSSQLSEEFMNNLDFCKKEMDDQYKEYNLELNNYIDKIISIENRDNLFSSRIVQSFEKLSEKMSKFEVKHLNILLVGPSGVGKSFLINTILNLEKDKEAETRASKPTTKSFNLYESDKIPNIRLIDSRGIEKGNYNAEELVKEITNYVEAQELSGNPDNFIHCIWYCLTGTRFEDIEEETLKKLSSIYDDSKLPIIVVYTQAIIPEYYNSIHEEVKKIKNNIEYIPVVAQDIKLSDNSFIKSKNIDILLIKSLEKSKNAVYSSVFSALRKIIKNYTDTQIEKGLFIVKSNLNKYISYNGPIASMPEFDEENNLEQIFRNMLFGHEPKNDLGKESKIKLIELIKKLRNKNNEIMGKCLNEFVQKKSNELAGKFLEIQTEVNQEKNGYLKQYKNQKDFSKEIIPLVLNVISDIVKNIGNINYVKLIPMLIVDLLSDKIKKEFTSIITGDSAKNIINKKIQAQFQRILSIVKKFKF